VHLHRAATSFPATRPAEPELLRHQRRVYMGLGVTADEPTAPPAPFQLKQITGPWGAGKSQVLARLRWATYAAPRQWLRHLPGTRPGVACVFVDIWKHDTERDLHRALVGEILGHPACVLPWGWLRHPVLATMASHLRNMDVSLPIGAASVSGSVGLPRLSWQRPLERTVGRLNRRRTRLVVVLDELDRASAVVAQAALSMVHRSLDLPGVTVVLVHVPTVVEQKVFSPLFTEIADLRSNATAQVLAEVERGVAEGDVRAKEAWKAIRDGVAADTIGPPEDASTVGTALDQAARAAYVELPLDVQRRIVDHLSEKFLRAHPLRLDAPDAADVAAMVTWGSIGGPLRGTLLSAPPGVGFWRDLLRLHDPRPLEATSSSLLPSIERAAADWQRRPLGTDPGAQLLAGRSLPPVRALKNTLEEVVSGIAAGDVELSEADMVAAVLLALETCRARDEAET
jgi:hypothetical protein